MVDPAYRQRASGLPRTTPPLALPPTAAPSLRVGRRPGHQLAGQIASSRSPWERWWTEDDTNWPASLFPEPTPEYYPPSLPLPPFLPSPADYAEAAVSSQKSFTVLKRRADLSDVSERHRGPGPIVGGTFRLGELPGRLRYRATS
jgi:hypothetical protein